MNKSTKKHIKEIKIAGNVIKPGEKITIELEAATLYTHTPIPVPIHVIRGKQDGPILLVVSTIHGDEINGVEITRRLLKLKILNKIRGTLIVIPVMNVYGFINLSRYLPDRRDLNRVFPGHKSGSLAARLANMYVTEILQQSTHVIDLHTGAIHRSNFPQVRANLKNLETRKLAKAFRIPVIIDAGIRQGSIRETANNLGIPIIVYEAGEALRFDEQSINVGVRGILSVMRELQMIEKSHHKEKHIIEPMIAHYTAWVRAPKSGIVHPKVKLGKKVHKNQEIGFITDPFGNDEYKIFAPQEGIVIGKNNLPLVNEGDALFNIGYFRKLKHLETQLERFQSMDIDEF